MDTQSFRQKYEGSYVEAGGSAKAKNQCVDLANQYIFEVLELPKILWTDAADFPEKAGDQYEWVENTPNGVPPVGAIIVFKSYPGLYGTPGHIAIVLDANKNTSTIFEQNFPTGSPCRVATRDYRGCRGWLICKKAQNEPSEEVHLSKALQHFNVKTEDELISMVDKEFAFLKDARVRVAELEQQLAASKEANKTQKEEYSTTLSQLEKKHALDLIEAKEAESSACRAKISEIEAAHAKELQEMEQEGVEKARENQGNGWRSVLSTLIRTLLEMIERKV